MADRGEGRAPNGDEAETGRMLMTEAKTGSSLGTVA